MGSGEPQQVPGQELWSPQGQGALDGQGCVNGALAPSAQPDSSPCQKTPPQPDWTLMLRQGVGRVDNCPGGAEEPCPSPPQALVFPGAPLPDPPEGEEEESCLLDCPQGQGEHLLPVRVQTTAGAQ